MSSAAGVTSQPVPRAQRDRSLWQQAGPVRVPVPAPVALEGGRSRVLAGCVAPFPEDIKAHWQHVASNPAFARGEGRGRGSPAHTPASSGLGDSPCVRTESSHCGHLQQMGRVRGPVCLLSSWGDHSHPNFLPSSLSLLLTLLPPPLSPPQTLTHTFAMISL